jgi:predicted RNase H-like HicB family nuclease
MTTIKFKYWQDQEHWIGYLEEYPDYITQGETFEELKENLSDIFHELKGGHIPNVRRVDELEIA